MAAQATKISSTIITGGGRVDQVLDSYSFTPSLKILNVPLFIFKYVSVSFNAFSATPQHRHTGKRGPRTLTRTRTRTRTWKRTRKRTRKRTLRRTRKRTLGRTRKRTLGRTQKMTQGRTPRRTFTRTLWRTVAIKMFLLL